MRRREFLGTVAAGAFAATGIITRRSAADEMDAAIAAGPKSNAPRLARREYGKTGIKLSVIGFPGFALRDTKDEAYAARLVAESVERGVNYFDLAASYGNCEAVIGPGLQPYRKDIFLSSKTGQRTADGAAADLAKTLANLKTDHLDLYNLHHIQHMDKDVDVAFGKGGAMEVLIQAKKEGRVRHLGFSAHGIEAALTAMDRYDFDSAIFPVNFACVHKGKWGPQIIDRCRQKGVAIMALKGMARQQWPKDDPKRQAYPICWYQPLTDLDDIELAMRFTLSQPIVAMMPPSSARLHRLAMTVAMDFKPIAPEEDASLKRMAEELNPVFTQA